MIKKNPILPALLFQYVFFLSGCKSEHCLEDRNECPGYHIVVIEYVFTHVPNTRSL